MLLTDIRSKSPSISDDWQWPGTGDFAVWPRSWFRLHSVNTQEYYSWDFIRITFQVLTQMSHQISNMLCSTRKSIEQIIMIVRLFHHILTFFIARLCVHLEFCEWRAGCFAAAAASFAWIQGISAASSGKRLIVDENEVRFDNIWNKARRLNPMAAVPRFLRRERWWLIEQKLHNTINSSKVKKNYNNLYDCKDSIFRSRFHFFFFFFSFHSFVFLFLLSKSAALRYLLTACYRRRNWNFSPRREE